VAKKADKALKSLKKDVGKLKKQNDKLAETLEKVREDQASAHKELRKLLEEHLTTHESGRDESATEDNSRDGEGEPEVTEAAERRAKDLGVDLSSVKGTGAGGRILVKDVEAVADAKQ
jgi:pyruvate/2-oxoglutarate dehydrogenase complex dihydrolipoamide acyltransferase (E2) component